METIEILKLVLAIVVGYFILKFLWNVVSGIFKLILVVILVGVGVYFVKPELLHDAFGKEAVESVATDIKKETKELADEGIKQFNSLKNDVVEDTKDEVKNTVDSVTL